MTIQWPLRSVWVTGEFANSPGFYAQFGQRGHNGIDLAADVGTPVYATDSGTIHAEGWGSGNSWMGSIAGIYVLIRHWWGYSGYAHLSSTIVNAGQWVGRGQLIGYSGMTGVGTGPHLHFETLPLSPPFGNGFAGRVNPHTFGLVPIPAPAPTPAPKPAPAPTPLPVPDPIIPEEDDEMATPIYVRDAATKGQGSIFLVRAFDGKRRIILTPEWNARRAAHAAAGEPVTVTDMSAADLKMIPVA